VVRVAAVLLEDPAGQHWGYDLQRQTGTRSGVLYPLLSRLLTAGWVSDGWEDREAAIEGKRPPRRYYVLTEHGRAECVALREGASRARRLER
jgi:PadR family transcriptional regulator PadR